MSPAAMTRVVVANALVEGRASLVKVVRSILGGFGGIYPGESEGGYQVGINAVVACGRGCDASIGEAIVVVVGGLER